MPNWVFNTMTLKESKKGALTEFLNDTLKRDGYNVNVKSGMDWASKVCNNTLCDNYKGIWLSTFVKRPETYDKYDTTNYPNGKGLIVGKTVRFHGEETIITEKLIQEYKDATVEQMTKYGIVGWYNWNCINYGCKWNTCLTEDGVDVKNCDGLESLTLKFETPWIVPSSIYEYILNTYPHIVLTGHAEDDMCNFCGDINTAEDENGRYLTWTDDGGE